MNKKIISQEQASKKLKELEVKQRRLKAFRDHSFKFQKTQDATDYQLYILQNKKEFKQFLYELGAMSVILASPGIMASYVVKFLEKNFPNLPEHIINTVKQIPLQQLLELIK